MDLQSFRESFGQLVLGICILGLGVLVLVAAGCCLYRIPARVRTAARRFGWPAVIVLGIFMAFATVTGTVTQADKDEYAAWLRGQTETNAVFGGMIACPKGLPSAGDGLAQIPGSSVVTDGDAASTSPDAGDTSGDGDAPASSTSAAGALTEEDFGRGFVLTRIGTGEAHDFTPPPAGANVSADWRAFGAASDWIYLAFEDWAFQLGTNEVDRLRVFSFGKVDPLVWDAEGQIATNCWFAPFVASLGIVPQANWPLVTGNENAAPEDLAPSQFWHFVTPSNTLQLTWQNVLLDRLTNTPVSVQMEVWPSGRFTYRYDLSHLDVEEVTSVLAGASFGGLEWITNAIPTNVTSLAFHSLTVEDATNPDRDGDGLATIDEIFVYDTDPGLADTDFDGLSDPDEMTAGTDPWNPDTDGDGLPDGEEVEIGTNPLSGDSDSDGIGDWQEVYEYGTDPLLTDTDGDGFSDAVETAGVTNPLKADSDDDGLDDPAEIQQGTNPNNPDTDGDGAPDGWEIANGSNPFVADTDGDGLADGIEMMLGSSPLLADTDGDGFGDLEEFDVTGTSPALADTDGDGLSDWLEADLMRVLASNSWVTAAAESNATIFATAGGNLDDAIVSTNLPFTVDICGVGFDRISIDTNGKVHLIPTNGTPVTSYEYSNKTPAELPKNGNDILVAPYWDDLMLRPHLASAISLGVDAECEHIIIGYTNIGLYDSSYTNASVTFQIVLSNDTNFPIRINYQSVSTNMTGESATIGVFDRRMVDCRHQAQCRSLVWAYEEEDAVSNGLSLGSRFGTGTNPVNADTDGDGLNDGDEFTLGTDPLNPDTDNDGLEDGAEVAAGASPFRGDTDNDGMPDAWEVRYSLNPNYRYDASTDADHDGLSNLQEFQIGSSPRDTDTDGDERSDYVEHNYGTSPILADTDGDGLDDKDEYQRGTSGTNPDSDYDGLPDGWEVQYNLNPKNSSGSYGASGDPDGDGLTNAEEYALGTNPRAKDTDGDGLDDGEEVGCQRRRYAEDDEWAASTNGWTAVTVETDPDWSAVWFTFDESLKIGGEWMYDVICQWNGLMLVGSDYHYPDDLVTTAPVNLSGSYVSDAALTIAPYWTESVTNSVSPTISVFKRGTGGNVSYAIQYTALAAGGTNTVSFQTVLVFTNGTYKATEVVYGDDTSDEVNGLNASIGVQDSVNGVNQTVGFNQYVNVPTYQVVQFIPGTGTDPLNEIVDSDGDGLSDDFERSIGTDPNQPDTDGDGMHDGWEHKYGFNPLINNDDTNVDSDVTNDSTYDADSDGLTNKQEADWGTDPNDDDTDNDGVTDGQEVENSSDPNDDTDGGRPASRVPVDFYFGDPSGSHSEKYRLVVKPEKNPSGQKPASGEEPKTFEWINAEYGECETKTAMLLRGWTYEVRMYHAGTNESGGPDYDYSLSCYPPSCVGVVTNDPSGLFQSFDDTSSYFSGEGKVAHVLVLDGCIVGDYDRKDGFTNYDLSRVYRNKPLRHWINDDDDSGDINEGDGDIPGLRDSSWWGATKYAVGIGKEPDYYNDQVDGKCDILDFTPVWVDMGFALQQLTTIFEGSSASDYALTLSQPEGAVNVVWTSLTTNNVSQFLTTSALENAETVQLTEEETRLPGSLISAMLENRAKGIFLFEGRALENDYYYGTKYITLRCYRKPYTPGESNHLFELKLPISVSPVEDMFRWIDERWVCGDTNSIPSRTGSPWNNPDNECDGRHFIFVHGYDVNAQSARGWAAEMFKRLRQSGSCSKFTAVDWYGNDSEIPGWVPKYGGEAPNYYANVEHSFATASRFVVDCASLTGQKIILAHSLGNMLVSSAIKDHDLTNYSKYYMLNAAVPMEAYDGDASAAAMVDHDWRAVSNRVYSSEWWQLFANQDGRRKLTWRERFDGIERAVNCYSTTEDTLGNATINEWLVGRWWRDKYWAMQELNKGTAYAAAAACLAGASPAAVEVPADCDVCVVGAGPAGIGAALASAAAGARTVVLERNGFVGGTTVSAEVTDIGLFHAWRKQVIDGPCYRLVTNAMARGNCRLPDVSLQDGDRNWTVGCHKVKPRVYEQAAREALLGAGIDLRLGATAVGAEEAPGGWRLAYRRGVELRALVARCVVDASGNAAVAAMAGAGRVKSDDATRQPGSYFFWLNTSGMSFDAAALNRAQEEAVRKGELLPTDLYVAASQFVRAGGGWGVYVPLADDSTEELRAETNRRGEEAKARIVGFLRRQPGLADAAVVRSARDVGVRETYRVVGEETITQADYLSGKLYPDSLCWSFWMIDPHDARAKAAKLIFHENGAVGAVRLGAMVPKGVRGMLVAGRAVSSDHGANSALRVQASCMGMGQVAGVAAALAARQGRDVRRLDLSEVRAALRAMGAIVPPDVVSLVKRRWKRAALQAVVGLVWTAGFFVALVAMVLMSMLGPDEDKFADGLTIPPEVEKDILIPERECGSDSFSTADVYDDDFARRVFKSLELAGGDDPAVNCDLAGLSGLVHNRREELLAYLARHPGWWLHEDRGNLCATRRLRVRGVWNHPLHGYYSGYSRQVSPGEDFEAQRKSAYYQTRTTIGLPYSPFGRKKGAEHPATGVVKAELRTGNLGSFGSSMRFGDKDFCVEVFEESTARERRLTKAVLSLLKDEFAGLKLPEDAVKRGADEFILRNGMQPGIYNLTLRLNPGESGITYLKAFEVTRGTRLSEDRLYDRSNERIGWSKNPDEKFLYENEFTIYEGDWGKPYAARIEVWFRPDSGKPERKLVERVCKVEGWQR